MSHRIIEPEGWAPPLGYAHGMLTEDGLLFVAGQVGWNAEQVFESHDFVGQAEQAFRNIRSVVEAAGGKPADITRLTWFISDKTEYMARQREIGQAYRNVLGRHFPAMSVLVVSGFIEDHALVEIEATAVIAT